MFKNRTPATATPSPNGGGWNNWEAGSQSSSAASQGYPAVNPRFKGAVPQVPISRPTNTFNPPPSLSGSTPDYSAGLTRQPRPPGAAPYVPKAKLATQTPSTLKPKTVGLGVKGNGLLMAGFTAIPKIMNGDVAGGIRDGVLLGLGYTAATAAAIAITGAGTVTAPVWAPVAVAIAGFAGASSALAIGNSLWGDKSGDGTEGSYQTKVIPVPTVPGQTGKTSNQYNISLQETVTLPQAGQTYTGTANLANIKGPISVEKYSEGGFNFGQPWTHQKALVRNGWGQIVAFLPFSVQPGQTNAELQITITAIRVDGTSQSQDAAQGGFPGIPGIDQTNVTNNITNGDTIINVNPAPNLGIPKTPTLPQPVAPPESAKPESEPRLLERKVFPDGQVLTVWDDGKGGVMFGGDGTGDLDLTTPQAKEWMKGWERQTQSPSGDNLPTPRPATATPGAPTTTAGTPTANLPETAPQTGTGKTITGQLQPAPAPSPQAKPNLTGGNLPTGNKQPTPTGKTVVSPNPAKSSDTGPNTKKVSETGEKLTPRRSWITNKEGELIGSFTDFYNEKGELVYSKVNDKVATSTVNTVENQIQKQGETTKQDLEKWVQEIKKTIESTPTNQTTVPTPDPTQNITTKIDQQTQTFYEQITENKTVTESVKEDTLESLAILGTVATSAFVASQTSTITTAIQNQPSPCSYPSYHPANVAERAAISGKVDGVNTVLGTVTNVQIAEAKTGITNIANVIGTPIANGAQTVLGGIDSMQTWLGKFAKSLYLDKIYNGLTLMVSLHNAAMLSRNLAETIGFFIDSGMQALNLKKEDETPLDLGEQLSKSIQNFLKDLVGNDIYNGISTNWKKLSTIYTSAVNILDNITQMLAGLAESMEIIGNYTGKIGNALKRGGVVLENAYNWMDDNLRLKTGKFAAIQKVVDGINSAEDVVNNLTEVTDVINEGEEQINEIKKEWADINKTVKDNEKAKKDLEAEKTTVSQGANIAKPDLITPEG